MVDTRQLRPLGQVLLLGVHHGLPHGDRTAAGAQLLRHKQEEPFPVFRQLGVAVGITRGRDITSRALAQEDLGPIWVG